MRGKRNSSTNGMTQIKLTTFALLLFALALGVPGVVQAAYNNVTYSVATTVVLTGPTPDITLTISASSNVNNILVYPNSIQVALERDATDVSSITFTSADKYNLNNDGSFAVTCGTTSSVTLTGPAAVGTSTYTLTPSLTTCGAGGGGGGGGSSSTTTTTTTTTTTDTTTTDTTTDTTDTTTTDTTTDTTDTTDTTTDTTDTTATDTTTETTTTTELQLVAIPTVSATPTVAEIQAAIDAILNNINFLLAELAKLEPSTTTVPSACSGVSFTRGLTSGSTGSDVKCLQALLNQSSDTQVALSGVGSPGNETSYFGSLSITAVGKFQIKKGLVSSSADAGYGYVGPKTRAQLNSLLGQ